MIAREETVSRWKGRDMQERRPTFIVLTCCLDCDGGREADATEDAAGRRVGSLCRVASCDQTHTHTGGVRGAKRKRK